MDKERNTSTKRRSKKLKTEQNPLDSTSSEITPITIPESTECSNLPKLDRASVEQLLLQVSRSYTNELSSLKKEKTKDISTLNTIIEEFLSCFFVVGFTLNNEKVCLFNAHSSKDESALVDHLRATFFEIINNRN